MLRTLLLAALVAVCLSEKVRRMPNEGASNLSKHADLLATLDGHPNEKIIREFLMKPTQIPQIILFEHGSYTGAYQIHTKSTENLHDSEFGFGDRLDSCIVKEGNWMLYEDGYYTNRMYVVEVGDYPDPQSWLGSSDGISSMRLLPCAGCE
ncbi:beta/gamma-crystallin-like [Amphiura filiformis]|uniref:beta/gamma-crystallin-like n=1 Tax=Amphiura filiformis TaxID=82378 RepID=UPI003B211A2B